MSDFDINEYLKTERNRQQFLMSAFEEDNGSGSSIRFALLAVAKAKSVTALDHFKGCKNVPIDKVLNSDTELTFEIVLKTIKALGYSLVPSTKETE